MNRKEYIQRLLDLADKLKKLIASGDSRDTADLVAVYLETLRMIREFGLL